MKIIIKESQLDKFIDNYITSQLGNLTKKEEKVKSSVDRWVFKNEKGNVMMVLVIGMNGIPKISINNDIYKNIVNLFGLQDEFISITTSKGYHHKITKIQDYLNSWVKNHMGLNSTPIDTFENGNEEFIY